METESHKPDALTESNDRDSGVTVRQMMEEDSDFAGQLCFEIFKEKIGRVFGEANLGYLETAMRHKACMAHLRQRVYIAECDGKSVGMLMIRLPGDPPNLQFKENADFIPCFQRHKLRFIMWASDEKVPPGKCSLETLAVVDGNRGKGIGQKMMEVAEQQAVEHKCYTIYLSVADGNRAKGLYERSGYAVVRRQEGWLFEKMMGSKFSVMEKQLKTT